MTSQRAGIQNMSSCGRLWEVHNVLLNMDSWKLLSVTAEPLLIFTIFRIVFIQ